MKYKYQEISVDENLSTCQDLNEISMMSRAVDRNAR